MPVLLMTFFQCVISAFMVIIDKTANQTKPNRCLKNVSSFLVDDFILLFATYYFVCIVFSIYL